ncbi:MAG: HpcH/HpaI aldolase family protein [Rhodospirillales bacterium]
MITELPANAFKQRLKIGEKQIGIWITLATPTSAEVCGPAGFDWMLIDMEHSPSELTDVVNSMRAATGGTAEPIVRIPWNDPVMVKRVLDAGARTILFPYVQNAAEATRAVQSTRYPPDGFRGTGGITRATLYGRVPNYFHRAHEEICVIIQVESPDAIKAIPEICKVDGLDAIFIGPNDLAANSGYLGQMYHEDVQAMCIDALKAIKVGGKSAGILTFNADLAKKQFDMGFDFIAVGGDATILARGVDELAKTFKGD